MLARRSRNVDGDETEDCKRMIWLVSERTVPKWILGGAGPGAADNPVRRQVPAKIVHGTEHPQNVGQRSRTSAQISR